MTIFVIIKTALESTGEWCAASTEAAFGNRAQAQAWLAGKPIVWDEMINGVQCYCERGVHETELTNG